MRLHIGLVSLAVLVGMAAPAYAEPADDASGSDANFLAALKKEGVSFKSGPVAITVGKKSCELMDQGHPKSQVIQSLSADNPGFSPESATKFATSAVSAYCPQHAEESNATPPPAAPSPTPPPPGQRPLLDFPVPTPGA